MENTDKVKEYWERVHGYAMRDEQLYKGIKGKKHGKVKTSILAVVVIAVIAAIVWGLKYHYDNTQKELEMIKSKIIGETFYVEPIYYGDKTTTIIIDNEHTLTLVGEYGMDTYEYILIREPRGGIVLTLVHGDYYGPYRVNINNDGSIESIEEQRKGK